MGQILHNSNSGVFMFQIFVAVVILGLSVTQITEMETNELTSSADYAALKQRVSALEADIIQVNNYMGSFGQLIRRYTEIESKFDKVLELNGEMQAMKHEIQFIKQSSRLCQPDVSENIEEVRQAVREVQSNVVELSETLQLKQGVEKMKIDMNSLKEDLKVRLNNVAILHAEDNMTLRETFAEGYGQLTENMNELEFKCQQNFSALQQIHALEFSNLQSNVSRLDYDLSTRINHTETINNRFSPARNKDCLALYRNGVRRDGQYQISPDNKTVFNVYCDMKSGGWTLIQRRFDDSFSFTRNMNEYVNGFDNLYGNFWLGLKYIHLLTSTPVDILIKVVTTSNEIALMQYSDFYIDGPENKYTMHINVTGRYNLVANNRGYASYKGFGYHNGAPFSTFDRPDVRNCVNRSGRGGWWYTYGCWTVLLNNPFKQMNVKNGYSDGKVTRSEIKIKRTL